jgi:hypothetical protein
MARAIGPPTASERKKWSMAGSALLRSLSSGAFPLDDHLLAGRWEVHGVGLHPDTVLGLQDGDPGARASSSSITLLKSGDRC